MTAQRERNLAEAKRYWSGRDCRYTGVDHAPLLGDNLKAMDVRSCKPEPILNPRGYQVLVGVEGDSSRDAWVAPDDLKTERTGISPDERPEGSGDTSEPKDGGPDTWPPPLVGMSHLRTHEGNVYAFTDNTWSVMESMSHTRYPDGNPKTVFGVKKPPISAVPPVAILALGMVMEGGSQKYGLTNWRDDPVTTSTYINAAARHLFEFMDGQTHDLESGVHNLAHVMACCAIILDAQAQDTLNDDRTKRPGRTSELIQAIAKGEPNVLKAG